jgi:HlyD family secretion protein
MRYLPILWLMLLPSLAVAADFEGRSEFARRVELNSSLSGRIETVHVRAGQQVAAGETVVTLVSTGLEAGVASARAETEALRPLVARTLTELEKAQELYARDSLAQVELEIAEQDYAIATARLAGAEAKLANALYRLSQAEIRSPIDGVVLEVTARAGVFVNTRVENRSLLTIVDAAAMQAVVSVPLAAAGKSLLGRRVAVRYADRVYQGKVVEVGRRAVVEAKAAPEVSVHVSFETRGELAAGLPVTVSLADD